MVVYEKNILKHAEMKNTIIFYDRESWSVLEFFQLT